MHDLIVIDIMSPVTAGIELLKKSKGNSVTAAAPVILVYTPAGVNEKIGEYDLGADDYLVKPFSPEKLLARVRSQISISKQREKALQDVYAVFNEVPFAVAVLKGESLIIDFINQYNLDIWQKTKEEVLGKPLFEARPDRREGAEPIHAEVYRTGKRFIAKEIPLDIKTDNQAETRYFNAIIDPLFDEQGKMIGQLATSIEMTEQVLARKKIEESETRFRILAEAH
jgi:CheY-like chemotaxis protein